MPDKTNYFPFYMSSKSEGRSLVSLLVERLFNQTENERNETFSTWFTYDEIDWFRDNADISKMNPLFVRYQDNHTTFANPAPCTPTTTSEP